MKKMLIALAVVALFSTTGCYTSRRVAGDDLVGGPTNAYLWVTVPADILMSPYQIPKWMMDEDDTWNPWDFDEIRDEYDYEASYADM